jgi:hypothetical protein
MKKYRIALTATLLASSCFAQEFKTITYPRKDVTPEAVFTQETLEKSLNYIFSWQQAAGAFGQLTLHSCWAIDGVIGRKYHGQFTSANYHQIKLMLTMYEETKDAVWKHRAENLVANLMFLQAQSGGFIHGAGEHEPAYDEGRTCAIHQNQPIRGLLEYAGKPYADPERKKEIKDVIDKHWAWFSQNFFKRGTKGSNVQQAWPWPCWSGVTNQDLTVIEALAVYGQVFGDMSRYNEFGKPALDVLFSPLYYYKGLGLFQRGDSADWLFPERTHYYHLIFVKLLSIYEITGDERIPPILDDVCEQLFRATFVGEDGLRYFAHGVNVEKAGDGLKVVSYNKYPTSLEPCLGLADFMDWYLKRHPDAHKQKIRDEIVQTAAAYVLSDGTTPLAFNPINEVFAVAPELLAVPAFITQRLKGTIKNFEIGETPAIQRKINDLVWHEKGRFYTVEKAGVRTFAGFKQQPLAIVHGPEETMARVDFDQAKKYGPKESIVVEIMNIIYDKEKAFRN